MASASSWHEGAATVILLPGGEDGLQILEIVEEWTRCWMLKPAFWVHSTDAKISNDAVPRISTSVVGRNGRREIDLLDYLSREDFDQVRLIAIRTVDQTGDHDVLQDRIVDMVKLALENARPYEIKADRSDVPETKFVRINLIFAPTSRKGASATHLLEPGWDINLVVAPEDRSTPSRFDKATRDVTSGDKDTWLRFILSNTAVTGGIWAGQEKGILETSNNFQDLSPVQGQVRIMRTFVRGVLSEGLSTRVAADALERASKAELSKIDPLRPYPNTSLVAFDSTEQTKIIDEMIEKTVNFSGGRLKYERVDLTPKADQESTGVFSGIKSFFKTTWSLLKVLPLWIFTGIWNSIAAFVSKLIFGIRGRKVVKGTIDFPRTDLDKGSEATISSIKSRREKIDLILANWPNNVLRKSEPILWGEMRKLVIGRLDGSVLPADISHSKIELATQVIGNLNDVIPDVTEKWELPSNLERLAPSQPRAATWLQSDAIEDLDSFLKAEIEKDQASIEALRTNVTESEVLRQTKEEELESLYSELEAIRKSYSGGIKND
jgi:hypothetical protein